MTTETYDIYVTKDEQGGRYIGGPLPEGRSHTMEAAARRLARLHKRGAYAVDPQGRAWGSTGDTLYERPDITATRDS